MSDVCPVHGGSGLEKLRALINLLQARQEFERSLDNVQDALQDLRNLINGNQRNAARQCQHAHHEQHCRAGNGPGREGVLQMLRKLMMLLLPMLKELQKDDGLCEPTQHALRHAACLGK